MFGGGGFLVVGLRQWWFAKFRGVCVVVFADGSCNVVGDLSPSLSLKSADGPATCMVVSAEMLVGLGRDLGW